MTYGIALIEKEFTRGLNGDDLKLLYGLVSDVYNTNSTEVYPIEIEAEYSSAMGLIRKDTASELDYDYKNSGLADFVMQVLNNKDKAKSFSFRGINIYIGKAEK